MAPQHHRVRPEPSALAALVRTVADDGEQPPSGSEPPGDLPYHGALPFAGNVDEGVEGDNGLETTGREVDLVEVRAQEPGGGYQTAGPTDLGVGDVDARDLEALAEDPRRRHPGARAQVKHPSARR